MRDSRLLRSLWEPLRFSSLYCTSDVRQLSSSVPVHFKLLSQTPSHYTVQPHVSPRDVFFMHSQAGPAWNFSIILLFRPSQRLPICHRRGHQSCNSLSLHCRPNLLPLAFRVLRITFNGLLFRFAIPSSSSPNVSTQDLYIGVTVSNRSNNSLQLSLTS